LVNFKIVHCVADLLPGHAALISRLGHVGLDIPQDVDGGLVKKIELACFHWLPACFLGLRRIVRLYVVNRQNFLPAGR